MGRTDVRAQQRSRSSGATPLLLLLCCAPALAIPLALLPLPYAAGAALAAAVALLALIHPIWAVYAAILSVPVQDLVALPGGLTVTQAALLVAAAALAMHTLAEPERPLPLGRLFPPMALLLLALAAATVFTPYSRAEALRETLRWATVPLIYVLTLRSLQGTGDRGQGTGSESVPCPLSPIPLWRLIGLLACLLLAPAIDAAVGLVQFWYGIGPASFGVGGGHVRAYGTIGQPNSFAGYMNQAWPLAVSLTLCALIWLWRGAPRRRGLIALAAAGGAAGLLLAALLTSFSRGGWVGALGGAAAMALASIPLLAPRLRRVAWRGVALAAGGLALTLALGGGGLLPGALAGRLGSITSNLRIFDVRGVLITPENFAVVERMAHIQAGWNMFVRHPITGVGPGNYSIAFERTPAAFEPPTTVRPWYASRGHAHNYYLNMAAEAGALGAAAYLLLLGAVGLQAARAIRHARGLLWRGVAVGCAGVTAALAVHNLFENLHVLNMGLQLGTTWALLVVAETSSSA
ncbi:O-antigen ligase family protein [Oscillochloris sp. ZM17-4]|uniref:O-antigen ligase family protein n=1 Tax=Oscillochloris sp. ZM17-4 TaxID=2866714 RepID=UPI001C72BB6D|nr:O-antigen ligase family protein [Oscillochloris sp. ZM17-4]MBX0329077.1 O-antigen ligase family protein [Oscillochloris sp. ZM17-4]